MFDALPDICAQTAASGRASCGRACSPNGATSSATTCGSTSAGYVDGLIADRAGPTLRSAPTGPTSRATRSSGRRISTSTSSPRTSTCVPARRGWSGAVSTSSSRPTSSIRSTCRGFCWRGAAKRDCLLASSAAACSCRSPRRSRRWWCRTFGAAGSISSTSRRHRSISRTRRLRVRSASLAAFGGADGSAPLLRIPRVGTSRMQGPRACRAACGSRRRRAASTGLSPLTADCRRFRSRPSRQRRADLKVGPYDVRESFPRFTMIGGDFETVRGPWGVRGEVAAFVDDELQSTRAVRGVPGHRSSAASASIARPATIESPPTRCGPGAASTTIAIRARRQAASQVTTRSSEPTCRSSSPPTAPSPARRARCACSPSTTRRRHHVHARHRAPSACATTSGSRAPAGLFTGSSLDIIGRLTRRDFAYARLKVFF